MYSPGNPDYITRTDAHECLKIVNAWLEKQAGPGGGPALYVDHEGPHWNIACEGALYDWPWLITNDAAVTWPKGVWVSAGNGWSLSLYPVREFHDPNTHLPPWCGNCRMEDAS
jgi:hypothetical protein